MTNSTQITFRIDEALHNKAKNILALKGGISKHLDERAYIKEQLARDDVQVLGREQSKERYILIDEVIERILQARLKS